LKKRITPLLVLAVAACALAFTGGAAKADYGPLAVYQVTFSFNCNNASLCGPDLGGFWGWAVFNSDGSVDAELTGCGHTPGGGGGAIHFHADGEDWFIQNGDFWISSEVDTYVGQFAHTEVISSPADTGIPAATGHTSTSDLFGFKAPPGNGDSDPGNEDPEPLERGSLQ
jgi:hypothetical protein